MQSYCLSCELAVTGFFKKTNEINTYQNLALQKTTEVD